jgi:DNA-binding beta-propeller fold protein YncE
MEPHGLATDFISLFVADRVGCTIRQVDLATGDTTTLAGSAPLCAYTNGVGSAARFYTPTAVAYLAGKLYIIDADVCAVRALDLADNSVSTLAGAASPGTCGYLEGTGSAARFGVLHGIVAAVDMLYVTDETNHRVRRINPANGATTLVAGSGAIGFVDGVGAAADLLGPEGLTWEGTSLYFVEPTNNAVRRVDLATGRVTLLVGVGPEEATEVDGPVSTARLVTPSEIVMAPGNGLFVTSGEQNWRWIR